MREPLLTDRLLLGDITEEDAQRLVDLDSDPEVMRYIAPRHAGVEEYRERIRTVYIPWQNHPWQGARLVHDRATGEFLGWVFVRWSTKSSNARELGWTQPSEVEVGFRFQRSAWGRGIATEAASKLVQIALADPETTAIVACAHADNARSLRVLEKLGLTPLREVISCDAPRPTVLLARAR